VKHRPGLLIAALFSTTLFSVFPRQVYAQAKPPAKAETKQSATTGCVDEQDGHYVLVDDHDLKPIADLQADGFPEEGFAKHVGHKVIIRGTHNPGNTRPLIKVRSIETVSETCAPQPQP